MWWEAAQPNKAALPFPCSPAPWNGSCSSIASQEVSGCFSELARLTALQRCLHLCTGMCELWGYIVKDHCNNLFVPHVCICSHVLEDLHTLGRVPHCCKLLTHMQPLFLDMLILPLTSFLCFIIDRDMISSIVLWRMLVSAGPLLDVFVDSCNMQWRCFTTSSKLNGVPARSSSWKFKHRTKALTVNAAC